MTSRGTKPPTGGLPELQRAQRDYLKLAVKLANQAMREQIYPILEQHLGYSLPARNWNPLRVSRQQIGDLSMKLFNPQGDPFVRAIMSDLILSHRVETIVTAALETALARDIEINSTPFLTAILRDLMKEDGTIEAESSEWPNFDLSYGP